MRATESAGMNKPLTGCCPHERVVANDWPKELAYIPWMSEPLLVTSPGSVLRVELRHLKVPDVLKKKPSASPARTTLRCRQIE